jgi:hypothetical protein
MRALLLGLALSLTTLAAAAAYAPHHAPVRPPVQNARHHHRQCGFILPAMYEFWTCTGD